MIETTIVLLIIAAAAGYLVRTFLKTMRGETSCGSCTKCGSSSASCGNIDEIH